MNAKIIVGGTLLVVVIVALFLFLTVPQSPSENEIKPLVVSYLENMPKSPGQLNISEATEIRIDRMAPRVGGTVSVFVGVIWEQYPGADASFEVVVEKQNDQWVVKSAELGIAD